MKKLLASSLIALAAAVALVSPAGAAVPLQRPALVTVSCDDGTSRVARVWSFQQKLAADNPCDAWLLIELGRYYYSGAPDQMLEVAPRTHFNWSKKRTTGWSTRVLHVAVSEEPACSAGPTGIGLVYSYDDVRDEGSLTKCQE